MFETCAQTDLAAATPSKPKITPDLQRASELPRLMLALVAGKLGLLLIAVLIMKLSAGE